MTNKGIKVRMAMAVERIGLAAGLAAVELQGIKGLIGTCFPKTCGMYVPRRTAFVASLWNSITSFPTLWSKTGTSLYSTCGLYFNKLNRGIRAFAGRHPRICR